MGGNALACRACGDALEFGKNWSEHIRRKRGFICNRCDAKKRGAQQRATATSREKLRRAHRKYDAKPERIARRRLRVRKSGPPGWVYILHHKVFPGYVKIGRTEKSVERRLVAYQVACPLRDFEIAEAKFFKDCWLSEGEVHLALYGFRIDKSEWFRVHPEDARAVLIAQDRKENY